MKIQEYIKNQILLFDGAMGSYFSGIHNEPLYPCEYANLTSPGTIAEIHKRYLMAGAKAIKTNTFSLPFGEESPFTVEEIIKSAWDIAKTQAEPFQAYVFADMTITPIVGSENAYDHYKSVVDCFLKEGATHFLFETCSSGVYLNELAEYIKKNCPEAFILTSFAVGADGMTQTGEVAQKILNELSPDVDAVGLNCITGPHHMAKLLNQLDCDRLCLAMPNASYPAVLGTRVRYSQNPSYFAEEMMEIAKQGCYILGGCCGTTPEFISQLNSKLTSFVPQEKATTKPVTMSSQSVAKSDFYEKLISGKKPIAVEWDTPSLPDINDYMAKAKLLKEANVDMLTIADCPVARPRLDSSLMACKLKRELDLHVMPHMTCRDRNINAAKALMLGLTVEEINNILVITGDPIPQQQRKEIKTVYEFNSRMLIQNIASLNQSLFTSPFYLYGALNINAVNFEVQLRMAKEKIANGACGLFTQPVMSERGYENLKIAKEQLGVPLVGGLFPATSYRNICFLTNEISGFHVAPELSTLYENKTPEECSELAIRVTSKIAEEIADYLDGFYLITPFQRVDLVLEILKTIQTLR